MKKIILLILLLMLVVIGNAMSKKNKTLPQQKQLQKNLQNKEVITKVSIEKRWNKKKGIIQDNDNDNKNDLPAELNKLKYSKIDDNLEEIIEYVDFFKNTLDIMQSWKLDYSKTKKKLAVYVNSMSDKTKSRFGYLDLKINNLYPEFSSEFEIINSRIINPVESGLYSEKELYFFSIYHKKTQVLPDILEIRLTLWKSLLKKNHRLGWYLNARPFYSWSVIKFIDIEKVLINHNIASPSLYTECIIVDSPFTELIGRHIKLAIPMFGSNEEYSLDKEYLVNYRYSFLRRPEITLTSHKIDIDPFRRFASMINRVYELSGDKIIFNTPKTTYKIDWHPLMSSEINSKKQLFSKLRGLIETLKEGYSE